MNLQDVKPGELLIHHYGRESRDVVRVDRVTARYIVIGDRRFRKESGWRAGESGVWLSMVTLPKEGEIDDIRIAHRRRKIAFKLETVKWREVDLTKLEAIEALL